MQLIIESDTVLDVKSNMSTDGDIQHHKMECFEVKDHNEKNINICTDGQTDANDIDSDLADKLIKFENNVDDVINRNLDTAISDQNKVGAKDIYHKEPKTNDCIGTLTSVDNADRCIIDKANNCNPEENLEEDDLEDDIISIRDESFLRVSETLNNIEGIVTENDEELLLEENLLNENNQIQVEIEKSPKRNDNDSTNEKRNDIMELSEEQDLCSLQSEKQTETLVEVETKHIESKDSEELSTVHSEKEREQEAEVAIVQCVKDTKTQAQKDIEKVDILIDPELISDRQVEKEMNTSTQEEMETVKDSKQTNHFHEQCEEEIETQEEMNTVDHVHENKFSNDQKETNTQSQRQIKEIKLTENVENTNTQCNDESTLPEDIEILETQEVKIVEPTEEKKHSIVLDENEKEAEIMEVDECIEIIKEVERPEDTHTSKEETKSSVENINNGIEVSVKEHSLAKNKEESSLILDQDSEKGLKLLDESSFICESKLESPIEKIKCDNNTTRDNNLLDQDSEDINLCKETKSSVEEIEVTNKTEIANKAQCDIIQSKNKTDSGKEDQCVNKMDSSTNIEIITAPNHNETSNSSETQMEISSTHNVGSPKVLNNDIVALKDAVMQTAENLGANRLPMEINMNVDEDVDNSSSNNEVLAEPNDISSKNSTNADNLLPSNTSTTLANKANFIACKSSYTLDIFSDEEDLPEAEPPKEVVPQNVAAKEKQCINIDDDDDIMLIDEDTSKTTEKTNKDADTKVDMSKTGVTTNANLKIDEVPTQDSCNLTNKIDQQETTTPVSEMNESKKDIDINEKPNKNTIEKPKELGPLIPEHFLSTAKTKLADMTRDDLEEFCILKIVESIVDRSSLSDIKNKIKEMTQGLEDYRKKATLLTRQNRDLQVVLKSIQEEQKKVPRDTPITPLKITRSVGVQVYMEKAVPRKKLPQQNINNKNMNTPQNKTVNQPQIRPSVLTKPANQNIPVPRLVPANNLGLKTPSTIPQMNTPNKIANPPNGVIRNPSPALKAEKRPHNKIASNETVDLTDDEPPLKMPSGPKTSPAPPVRLVPSQNLMAPQRQPFPQSINSPRKVYIPISGPPNQALRPGQTIMLKSVPPGGLRPRGPTPQRMDSMRLNRVVTRHPAPLPFATKQYQPPNWKSLPPAPDLKLSKVENGIVISWKIEDVPEDSYEEIASYQLFAYQETSLPANTALWKKIGDVKALPLPMACTLTQFMAGFKYYFAVRAVDIRSRLGPFSLPGSILLLNKNILD